MGGTRANTSPGGKPVDRRFPGTGRGCRRWSCRQYSSPSMPPARRRRPRSQGTSAHEDRGLRRALADDGGTGPGQQQRSASPWGPAFRGRSLTVAGRGHGESFFLEPGPPPRRRSAASLLRSWLLFTQPLPVLYSCCCRVEDDPVRRSKHGPPGHGWTRRATSFSSLPRPSASYRLGLSRPASSSSTEGDEPAGQRAPGPPFGRRCRAPGPASSAPTSPPSSCPSLSVTLRLARLVGSPITAHRLPLCPRSHVLEPQVAADRA